MPRLIRSTLLILTLAAPVVAQDEVEFPSFNEYSSPVFALRYEHAGDRLRGTALVLHDQASNAFEYVEITPRLVALGFDVLAPHLITGNDTADGHNPTPHRSRLYVMTFDDGLPDAQAALDWLRAEMPARPIVIFGSGVSADMAILMAADTPEGIGGLLVFSPPSMQVYADEAAAAAALTMPVFATYATQPADELAMVSAVTDAVAPDLLTLHRPDVGLHGAHTLDPRHNPDGWSANWEAVTAFLDRVAP